MLHLTPRCMTSTAATYDTRFPSRTSRYPEVLLVLALTAAASCEEHILLEPECLPQAICLPSPPKASPLSCDTGCLDFAIHRFIIREPWETPFRYNGKSYYNAIGSLVSAFAAVAHCDLSTEASRAPLSGALLNMIRVHLPDLSHAQPGKAQFYRAHSQTCCSSPEIADCEKQALQTCFNGTHLFSPDASTFSDPLIAPSTNTFKFGPGRLRLSLPIPCTTSHVELTIQEATLAGTIFDGRILGEITGAIAQSEFQCRALPVIAQQLTLALDSPRFTSQERRDISILFANGKDHVTVDDLVCHKLIVMSLSGDVDTDHDGVPELSIGFRFEGVAASVWH